MTHYLLVYRRSTGKLQKVEDLGSDRQSALKRRFECEKHERHDPDVEVVLLGAASREALLRTHARYFKDVRELAEDLGTVLPH